MASQTKSGKNAKASKPARRTYTPEEIHELGTPRVAWKACFIGLVAGELALLVLVLGGTKITDMFFGTAGLSATNGIDGGVVGVAQLLAVIFGGYIAGRRVDRFWGYQGIIVGVGFIVLGELNSTITEAMQLHSAITSGSHTLVNINLSDMGNLFATDFLALFGGSVGGWLAHKTGKPVSVSVEGKKAVSAKNPESSE